MPCSFGRLRWSRAAACAQRTGLPEVTVTDRCIPLLTAAYGTRVARPARTAMFAPGGVGSQLGQRVGPVLADRLPCWQSLLTETARRGSASRAQLHPVSELPAAVGDRARLPPSDLDRVDPPDGLALGIGGHVSGGEGNLGAVGGEDGGAWIAHRRRPPGGKVAHLAGLDIQQVQAFGAGVGDPCAARRPVRRIAVAA